MNIHQYISSVQSRYKSGISREHSYRRDLEELLRHLTKGVDITNEPANVTNCGNPDYVLTKGKIPIGYIEAKDVGKDLNSKNYKEQFTRYKEALDNLIITDYLWFQFFVNGELVHEVKLGEIVEGKIVPRPENYDFFSDLIQEFVSFVGQTIKSPAKLAKMMASKARLLQDIMERAAISDEESEANTTLKEQYRAFKTILIHDLTPKQFADVYAQTLAYGMFSARYQDETLNDFSRQEAAELIPKSNPFLRKLFQYIAGYDIDERILTTVNNLAEVFRATNVREIMHQWGAATQQNDPVIHFYETFLAEYDPKLRKSRGVWYTPEPVVNFMVIAVDDILKTEFGLKDGLADNSKIKVKVNTQVEDKRSPTGYKQVEKEVHKVQILDPATGTGTFLAEIIKQIYNSKFQSMQGVWSSYVENDLIPRLNGFEILMASYAMAHLKLDLLLKETGYKPTKDQRLRVYLTNSLEEYHPDTGTLFANWLSSEANEANAVKRDTPVMVMIGNPPYSGESQNKGDWIMNLMEDYKKEPDSKRKLNEKTSKWINDDYVKFIRYAQYFINKNSEGVIAYINPHGFIDNPTFRGMRWSLLSNFTSIYIIDLHGNSNKSEDIPNDIKDENVFDIKQGVSINIFIKKKEDRKDSLASVYHYDIYGKRHDKYHLLFDKNVTNFPVTKVNPQGPNYYFIPFNYNKYNEYKSGFSLGNLFIVYGNGITTAHDDFVISNDAESLQEKFQEFKESVRESDYLHSKFNVRKKNGWDILKGFDAIRTDSNVSKYIQPISYRPFDRKYIFYEDNLVWRTVRRVMDNYLRGDNLGILTTKAFRDEKFAHVFVTSKLTEAIFLSAKTGSNAMNFPLYIYHEDYQKVTKSINYNKDVLAQIERSLNTKYSPGSSAIRDSWNEMDLFYYIYSVLHSPTYRKEYNSFLKKDFPRIPYPCDILLFRKLALMGKELADVHTLQFSAENNIVVTYPKSGSNTISRKLSKNNPGYIGLNKDKGKVWINDEQYFDNVPLVAWEFYIGGYQPAQKWLKDRVGRTLSYDDILHYQKIIAALVETDRIMKEIDEVKLLNQL